jgi:hypothetical protein
MAPENLITWKNCQMLSHIGWISINFVKIDESWENYFVEFNESSQ